MSGFPSVKGGGQGQGQIRQDGTGQDQGRGRGQAGGGRGDRRQDMGQIRAGQAGTEAGAGIWRAFAICGGDDFDNNLPADGKTRKEAYQ